ncbi:MAG: 8-oxo-dGTP diphosphatase MutT [Pyramidobacter sp.]|nr:8-oxo-dGTP diphosphatase MutT [Pyramidobacter sp.]
MIDVAAAVIRNEKGEILICRRGSGGNCANLWEFPGGKREPGETMEECLVRECREELEVGIVIERLMCETTFAYPDRVIHFNFFDSRIADGTPKMDVHQDMKWVEASQLKCYAFCPADAEIVAQLAASSEK